MPAELWALPFPAASAVCKTGRGYKTALEGKTAHPVEAGREVAPELHISGKTY